MNVFSLEIRNTRKSAVMWAVSIGSIIFFMLAFFPSMQSDSMQSLAGAKMEGIDPALLAAFGLEQLIDFTVLTNFFGYVLQFITLALMVYATQNSVSLLVKEETDGTIEYLYGKPVSRREIFFQKLLAMLALFVSMLAVFAAITVIGYIAFSEFTLRASIKEALIFYGSILFVGFVFMSVGVLLSAWVRSSRGASGIAIAIVFGTYVLGILSVLIESLNFMVYLSPMDWIKTGKLMSEGILLKEWLIGIAVIGCCMAAAYARYSKRDLLV